MLTLILTQVPVPTDTVEISALGQILEFIKIYGLATVLLLIVLYYLYQRSRHDQLKKDEEDTRDQARQDADSKREQDRYDTLMSLFLSMQTKLPDPGKESVELLVGFNARIHDRLYEMLTKLSADYVQLWQFHNGTYGIGNPRTPFMMMTPTHLLFSPGHEPEKLPLMQLPMSLYLLFSADLAKQELITITSVDGNIPSAFENVMLSFGAKESMIRAIRDGNGHIVAFVVAAWDKVIEISEDVRNNFVNNTQTLAAIMAKISIEDTSEVK